MKYATKIDKDDMNSWDIYVSKAEFEKLTPEQEAMIPAYREQLQAIALASPIGGGL